MTAVVITAGGRIDGDFARVAGTSYKALLRVGERSALDTTIDALAAIGIERVAVVGDETIARVCAARVTTVVADRTTGSGNVLAALEAWGDEAFLYLTCDMPFVDAAALDDFLQRLDRDSLSMATCSYASYVARFANAPPAGITLGGRRIVNGGAFWIPANAGASIASFATRVFDARKSPWKMAAIAGPSILARFLCNRLTVDAVADRASRAIGLPARVVEDCSPGLAFDLDTLADFDYARSLR